ncbi:MAG: hypothetical protein ABSA51_07965, partial [Anaerolineaceae bacterium]
AGSSTPVPQDWISKAFSINNLQTAISPDGQWLASIINQGNGDILHVISTSDENHILEGAPDDNLDIISWAPNNSSILAANINWPDPSPCHFRNAVIYSLAENATELSQIKFVPSNNDYEYCFVSAWAPDGKELAISFTYHDFYIIDVQGRVLYEAAPKSDATSYLMGIWWTNAGLIQRVRDNTGDELRLIDTNSPEQYSTLMRQAGGDLLFLGSDSNATKLLLSSDSYAENNQGVFHLQVLEVKTKKILFNQVIDGQVCTSSGSNETGYTALQIAEPNQPCGGTTYLWIYDWQSGEFTKLFPISALLGWHDNPDGFEVITETASNGYMMTVVSPQNNHE